NSLQTSVITRSAIPRASRSAWNAARPRDSLVRLSPCRVFCESWKSQPSSNDMQATRMPTPDEISQASIESRRSNQLGSVVSYPRPDGGRVTSGSPDSVLAIETAPPTAWSAASMPGLAAVRCDSESRVPTISDGSAQTLPRENCASSTLVSTATGLSSLFSEPSSDQSTDSACSGLSATPFWSIHRPSQPVAGSGSSSPACQKAREWKCDRSGG